MVENFDMLDLDRFGNNEKPSIEIENVEFLVEHIIAEDGDDDLCIAIEYKGCCTAVIHENGVDVTTGGYSNVQRSIEGGSWVFCNPNFTKMNLEKRIAETLEVSQLLEILEARNPI